MTQPYLTKPTFLLWCYACFTLADPTPRLCPDAVGLASVNGFPTRNRLSPHRETIRRPSGGRRPILNMYNIARCRRPIRSRTCTMQLSFTGSCNKSILLHRTLTVPTDAIVRIVCHLANVNGSRRDVGWFCPDLPPTTSEANRGGSRSQELDSGPATPSLTSNDNSSRLVSAANITVTPDTASMTSVDSNGSVAYGSRRRPSRSLDDC